MFLGVEQNVPSRWRAGSPRRALNRQNRTDSSQRHCSTGLDPALSSPYWCRFALNIAKPSILYRNNASVGRFQAARRPEGLRLIVSAVSFGGSVVHLRVILHSG